MKNSISKLKNIIRYMSAYENHGDMEYFDVEGTTAKLKEILKELEKNN